jgi:fibronectin-binding autotransporter adhesin
MIKKISVIGCLLLAFAGKQVYATDPLAAKSTSGVDLISFEAIINTDKVDLKWVTKAENVNAVFIVEKSKDGKAFEEVMRVTGAGKGNFYMEYFDADYTPIEGVSYYRLKQANETGEEVLHNIVAVSYFKPVAANNPEIALAANPGTSSVNDFHLLLKGFEGKEVLVVLRNKKGDEFFSKVFLSSTAHYLVALDPERTLPSDEYLVTASVNNKIYSKKITVR